MKEREEKERGREARPLFSLALSQTPVYTARLQGASASRGVPGYALNCRANIREMACRLSANITQVIDNQSCTLPNANACHRRPNQVFIIAFQCRLKFYNSLIYSNSASIQENRIVP